MAAKKGHELRPNPKTGRYRLISGNWKMNMNHLEAIQLVQKLYFELRDVDYAFAEISLHPPATDLRSVQLLIESDRMRFSLGAQNCYYEASGAYTGEVSASMLAKLNVRYVIVGHSERRRIFGETDAVVAKKVAAVFAGQMTPILCVGETLEEREEGRTDDVVMGQVRAAVSELPGDLVSSLVIAYEPIWAIGTGRVATPDDAASGAQLIREELTSLYGEGVADSVRVQYGGSVTPTTAAELLGAEGVDGLLVGGASLDADAFARVIRA
ncbi:MAG: triose-phosphate isomerase [Actinomycetota bacterium]|nr:triose-phosphate isomerase [Actinomycetota bacterium]